LREIDRRGINLAPWSLAVHDRKTPLVHKDVVHDEQKHPSPKAPIDALANTKNVPLYRAQPLKLLQCNMRSIQALLFFKNTKHISFLGGNRLVFSQLYSRFADGLIIIVQMENERTIIELDPVGRNNSWLHTILAVQLRYYFSAEPTALGQALDSVTHTETE